MNINRVTIRNVNLFFQINAFVEKFADMQMIFLIDFFRNIINCFSTKQSEILSFSCFFECSYF